MDLIPKVGYTTIGIVIINFTYAKTIKHWHILFKCKPRDNLAIYSADYTKSGLVSESNVPLLSKTIAVVPIKSIHPVRTNQKNWKCVSSSFLCIDSPCKYVILTIYRFPEKILNKILLFVINACYENMNISKGLLLAYLLPLQYEPYLAIDENNNEKIIHNILAVTSETYFKFLPAIQVGSKMIFHGDHTPIWKTDLQE